MRRLLTITLLVSISLPVLAQDNISEAYFHELRGMEDSTGVTHLFYRMYKKTKGECSENNGGQTLISWSDNIYHYNTETKSDSLKFDDYYYPWCIDGMYSSEGIIDYDFYDNDPKKWLVSSSFEYFIWVEDYLGNTLNFEIPIAVKRNSKPSSQDYYPMEFYLSPNQDSLFMDSDGTTIPFPGEGEDWPEFQRYDDFLRYSDSLSFAFEMQIIHPVFDSIYFAKNVSGHLFQSDHYSGNFQLADSSGSHPRIAFDADPSIIYSLITGKQDSKYFRRLFSSDIFGENETWEQLTLPETGSRFEYLLTDSGKPGHIFIADSNYIYSSKDFGRSFSEINISKVPITGLYKKPNSDLLYVLTTDELLEVNTETKATTSLKQLPVSNEPIPEIPNQISLEQNYPNPFNPSTVISYQLTGNSFVRLEVFDVTGRKVATLVDGDRKTAGTHRADFDASGLASGVYFYRLTTSGQTLTRKMLLLK